LGRNTLIGVRDFREMIVDISTSSSLVVQRTCLLWLVSIWAKTTADRVSFVGESAKDEQYSCSVKTHLYFSQLEIDL
jgi:hypothetical protein